MGPISVFIIIINYYVIDWPGRRRLANPSSTATIVQVVVVAEKLRVPH
jgi:hypothetical protein